MAGTRLEWFPLYVADLMASRAYAMMSNEQFGMYVKLLMREWSDGPLPTDAQALLRLCSGNAEALPMVLQWFTETPEGYINENLEALRKDQEDRASAASERGRKGAKSRWGNRKRNNASALPKQEPSIASAMLGDGSKDLYQEEEKEEEHTPEIGRSEHQGRPVDRRPERALKPESPEIAAPEPERIPEVPAVFTADEGPATRCARLLAQLITTNDPGAPMPTTLDPWAQELQRLHSHDRRSWDEIGQVVEWCQGHRFWMPKVLSAKDLRKHFTRMRNDMLAERTPARAGRESVEEKRSRVFGLHEAADDIRAAAGGGVL